MKKQLTKPNLSMNQKSDAKIGRFASDSKFMTTFFFS